MQAGQNGFPGELDHRRRQPAVTTHLLIGADSDDPAFPDRNRLRHSAVRIGRDDFPTEEDHVGRLGGHSTAKERSDEKW